MNMNQKNFKNQKIYLGDSEGNYELKRDSNGIPYIESNEIIESFKNDEREDDEVLFIKDLINAMGEYTYTECLEDITITVLDNLHNNLDSYSYGEKCLVKGLLEYLKEKY